MAKFAKAASFALLHVRRMLSRLSASFNDKGYRFVELINDECTGCANCALVCPEAAIKVYREPKPAKKIQA